MKCLVTGGAGFIGGHIQDKLVELGHDVAVLDNLSSGRQSNLNPKSKLYKVDIREQVAVNNTFVDFKPEVVFHLAAQADVPTSTKDPHFDLDTNIRGTLNVLLACNDNGVKKIVYTNTGGAYYGDVPEDKMPITEDTVVVAPSSFYGTSKFCAEHYVKLFGHFYNLPFVSLRYANVYGPRQDGNKEAGVIAIFTTKLLKKEIPTINGDGKNIRDYVYVGDVVDANIKAMEYQGSDYFNIGAGNQIDVWQVFQEIEKNLQTKLKPATGPGRKGDVFKYQASIQKAKEKLNWEPKVDFEKGVKLTIDYYKNKLG